MSIGVPSRRINEIAHDERRLTADTALPLARCFGTSPEFWLSRQGQQLAGAGIPAVYSEHSRIHRHSLMGSLTCHVLKHSEHSNLLCDVPGSGG